MKKIATAFMAFLLVISLYSIPQATAATPIRIYIDGSELATDQAPVVSNNHVLVPLRGIFEALHATVLWNQQTKTVTALKDGTTVVLQLGSKTATINGQVTVLETPGMAINGRTLVPVRFVSEALGQSVDWQPSTRRVVITTDGGGNGTGGVSSVSYVSAAVTGQNGNGSDVRVNFERPANQTGISGYRILIVKEQSASAFTLAKAQAVSSANYTFAAVNDGDSGIYLSSQARDTDGSLIATGNTYKVFVLTAGKTGSFALSSPSSSFSLLGRAVAPATNVKLSDIGNYGDGRDLSVTFTKAQTDSNISGYRIFIVKTKDASKFTLSAATATSSQYYTSVGKTGSTITVGLSSGTKDTGGDYLKNGVPYTAFVLSVSSVSGTASQLSAASASLTLSSSSSAPVISGVYDVSNYGDGRDLQVLFSRSADESKVGYYRVFVVRTGNAGSFNLNSANSTASGRYYDVSKSGSGSISVTLPSNIKDVQGYAVTTGVSYQVFVLAVSSNSSAYPSVLSAASPAITLTNGAVNAVTNLAVNDVSDYGDGRDLLVSFTRAQDESSISHYRVFVVKSTLASSFDAAKAGSLSSSYYAYVSASGINQSLVLSQSAVTSDGSRITEGVSYRIFVLSVAKSGYSASNVLAGPSSAIVLSSSAVQAVSSVGVTDISDYGDGRDLQVAFNKPTNESNISHYRIFVVKANDVSSFNVTKASGLSSSYYTYAAKTGGNQSVTLSSGARSTDGSLVVKGQSYRIFVLSAGTGGTYALSSASAAITLSDNIVIAPATNLNVSDTADNGDGRDLRVSFSKAPNESNIAGYRVIVVKDSDAASFNLAKANDSTSSYYTEVSKTGSDISLNLSTWQRAFNDDVIKNGVKYRVFVLSVGVPGYSGSNALSAASGAITLTNNLTISPVTGVTAALNADNTSLAVGFTKSDSENLISEYRILIVPAGTTLSPQDAAAVSGVGYISVNTGGGTGFIPSITKDYTGKSLQSGTAYVAYVLAVSKGSVPNALSAPSTSVSIPAPAEPSTPDSGTNGTGSADSGTQPSGE